MKFFSKYKTQARLARAMPDINVLASQVETWFQSPQGKAVFKAEQEVIHGALEQLFGYHILQLGFSEKHSLIDNSPIGHKITFSASLGVGSQIVANNEELPLSRDSVDVVVMHHALDFAENSHGVLREAARVLRPGGHMLIVGFNPYSFWGAWKIFKRRKHIPWRGKFISKGRVCDWLKLLDLHIDSISYGLHFFPLNMSELISRAEGFEKFGNKLRSPFGGAYFIHCVNQSVPITPILPKWRSIRARSSVMPAAENLRAKIRVH